MVENGMEGKFDADIPYPPTIEAVDAIEDAKKAIYGAFKKSGAELKAKM